MTTPKPRAGSPVALAIAALTAEGKELNEATLAERIEVELSDLRMLLNYGVIVGLLVLRRDNNHSYYFYSLPEHSKGHRSSATSQVDDLTVEALAREMKADSVPTVAIEEASNQLPAIFKEIDVKKADIARRRADLAEKIAVGVEVAHPKRGLSPTVQPPKPPAAPEVSGQHIVSSLEVAIFSDARLALEIDGRPFVLPPALTRKLVAYLDRMAENLDA